MATTPFEDYEKCRDEGSFGKSSLICDPEKSLKNSTIEKLDALLKNLQVRYGLKIFFQKIQLENSVIFEVY